MFSGAVSGWRSCCRAAENDRTEAGTEPETEGMRAVFRTLYEREREAAREKAAAEALEIFSQCPVCGRLVCNRCFLICEDLDL